MVSSPVFDSMEQILARFGEAWNGPKPPRIEDHLGAGDPDQRVSLLVELIRIDLERRLTAGERLRVEEAYLRRFPELGADTSALVTLVKQEFQLRRRNEPELMATEYVERFPQCQEELWAQLKTLNDALRTGGAPPFVAVTEMPPEFDARAYHLMEELGKGGMGEVHRCCDPALGRDLAIKVMKLQYRGRAEAERRFLREARVTGSLQHPGIVPVHNLGRLADGRLHYTMRLVRGQTFAAILKEEAGKPERLPYLLTSFEKICQAVAYAHSKHVIHRDLKPHNVMVGRFGEVQVMDWGLAKVLTPDDSASESEEKTDAAGTRIPTEPDTPADLSRTGSGFGTPAYMPPEQALGEWDAVDERADVFALGSILCEMLTGEPAYCGMDGNEVYRRAKHGDVAEALQRLQECEADTSLTALCRECLSPEREARPHDADAVAKRVADYQAEVQERLRQAEIERAEAQLKAREARKQRRLLIALVVTLLGGGALSAWQALRATAERDDKEIALGKAVSAAEAEHQAREAEAAQRERTEEQKRRAEDNARKATESEGDTKAVLEFFQEKVLSAGRPEGLGGGLRKGLTLREAVDAAESDIAESFADRPLVAASIRATLGLTYWYLGDYPKAIEQHIRALELRRSKLGSDHPDVLTSRNNLALAYHSAGRIADAIRLHEQNLKLYEAKLGPDHPDTLHCCNNLAAAYLDVGRTADAIPLQERTLKQKEAKLGPDHPDTLQSRNNLAVAYRAVGRITDAIRLHEQTLKQREATLGPDHPDTMRSRNNLAVVYEAAGRIPDAIHHYEQALKRMESKLGSDHSDTLTIRDNLAVIYLSVGRIRDAIGLNEETLKQTEAKHGKDHSKSLAARHNLALSYRAGGRGTDAVRLDELNLKLSEEKFGTDHADTLVSMGQLGVTYAVVGRLKDAAALFEQVLERGRKLPGGFPAELAWVRGSLAETYDRAGQLAKAEVIYRELLEQARHQLGTEDVRTAGQMAVLAFNLLRQHKYSDAELLLRDCLKVREAKQPDDWATFNTRSLLGAALLSQKKYVEAEPLLLQGYEGMKARQAKIPPQARVRLTEALERLVQLYEARNKRDEAAKWRKQLEERNAAQKKTKPF
jgi:serine/threonine protein kinase